MNVNQEREFLAAALMLAKKSSRLIMDLYQKSLSRSLKDDQSIVTEADLLSDCILREGLRKRFPNHAILTEEHGLDGSADAEWVWLIDPLDGTKAYAKGVSGFSILVALLHRRQPYLGVIIDPLQGLVYEAIQGHGAFVTDKEGSHQQLYVSQRSSLREMPLVTSTGLPQKKLAKILDQLDSPPLCQPINSVGIKVGLVARQIADVYLNHHSVHYWDTCAPQVILQEAGGVLTRLDGAPLEYSIGRVNSHNSLTLATNGARHQEISNLLSPLFPART